MRYILVTGGQMLNKGAQAMTFTVISEMKKAYPKSTIVLLSSISHAAINDIQDIYNFEIIHFTTRLRLELSGGLPRILNKTLRYKKFIKNNTGTLLKLKKYFEKADYLIDISGFALSSQMGFRKSCSYLLAIAAAKNHHVPAYILPQSFGPFNYPNIQNKVIIWLLMKMYLKYPVAVYARESEGFKRIKRFNNVAKLSHDIVLQSKIEYDIKHIFKHSDKRTLTLPEIEGVGVGIIPNEKTFLHGNSRELYDLFNDIIKELLNSDIRVYLLPHCNEDAVICKTLKNCFSHDSRVTFITDEYDCIELEKLISRFEFIIASRYHSIVHAYRKSVPVIALGWAVKYQELLSAFKQDHYLFDVRHCLETKDIITSINDMINNRKKNTAEINTHLEMIQKNNIFDTL